MEYLYITLQGIRKAMRTAKEIIKMSKFQILTTIPSQAKLYRRSHKKKKKKLHQNMKAK